ncbi:MAG: flavodoxin family protein [Desulfobulbaceae bacterium]|nr:flavodoxin family protein [Desulfobulbaceae bacterium]
MNIVCLLGSPRSNGNSTTMARRFLETAAGLGAATRVFSLNSLNYKGCQGCYACKKDLDHCILKDDLSEVLAAVRDADILVSASPVYFGEVSSQLKGFIDRTFSYLKPDYLTNPNPSRLQGGKQWVFMISQGHGDSDTFADIYPRYAYFMKWLGFGETHCLRACGVRAAGEVATQGGVMAEVEALARQLMVPKA